MFLSFSIADIIQVPFGYLLDWLYQFSGSYGFALIVFSIVVQLVLLPMTAKSKKSMMKMSRLQPQMQEIQRRYARALELHRHAHALLALAAALHPFVYRIAHEDGELFSALLLNG